MSGLYFKYGTMNSSKSANLLMCKYNYESQGFKVRLLKPIIDTRCDIHKVESRVGISADCTPINFSSNIKFLTQDYDIVMVDECQFLTKELVDQLYKISFDKVVMCYGLLTDFRREMFEGSKRLIELADSIQEIKSVCKCGKRAVVNARFKDGVLVTEGSQIVIGAEDKYKALCKNCYEELKESKE